MVHISQLILGDTGCVSYIIHCKEKEENAIVDSFEGFEEDIHEELKRLAFPMVKYVIDTHTHADRKSASGYFAGENGLDGVVKSEMTKYKGKDKYQRWRYFKNWKCRARSALHTRTHL